ncbi:hypothetical protein BBJ28_00008870 [Nothophytophthora sp. Chile5]|nr:hypothetical protein BBJ28_00008870 [Nothophytophthora sp. Chile5]
MPTSEFDTAFKALELLTERKVVDDKTRRKLKKSLFTASERQFKLLNKALSDFLVDDDHVNVLEWIDAFLEAHKDT